MTVTATEAGSVAPEPKALKVRFATPVKFGFKSDTKGFEASNLGDEYVYQYKLFNEGDEFTFPAVEADAVRRLVADGGAVLLKNETKAEEKPAS